MNKKHWSPQEIACLRAIYPHRQTREVAELLGRSMRSVYDQAHQLDLKKTPEFLASGQAGRHPAGRQKARRHGDAACAERLN